MNLIFAARRKKQLDAFNRSAGPLKLFCLCNGLDETIAAIDQIAAIKLLTLVIVLYIGKKKALGNGS